MSTWDPLEANARYVAAFEHGGAPAAPSRRLAVLTCMDARLDPLAVLGLSPGEAHVIRNAGGVATDDAVRSLLISQRLLGTEEIFVIHHSDCGMERFNDDVVKADVAEEVGIRPPFALEAFPDARADVSQTVRRLQQSAFVDTTSVRGFLYDVATGRLEEVPV